MAVSILQNGVRDAAYEIQTSANMASSRMEQAAVGSWYNVLFATLLQSFRESFSACAAATPSFG